MNDKEYLTYRNMFGAAYGRLFIVLTGTILSVAGNVFLRWSIGEGLDTGKWKASWPIVAGVLLALWPLLHLNRQKLFVQIQKNIYWNLQRKILRGSMVTIEKNNLGAVTTCYVTDVTVMDRFVNRILEKALPDLIGWLITVGLMFWFDLFLGIAAVVVTVLPTFFLHRMSRPVAKGTREYQEALEAANQSVVTGLYNLETIKASCKEADFWRDNREKLEVLQKKKRSVALWEAILAAPMMVSTFATIIFMTALSGWFVLAGRISTGQLLTVVTLIDNIVSFVMSQEGTISAYRRASVSRHRLNGFLGQEEERQGGREVEKIREIVFDRICFAYPDGSGKELYHGFSERWQQGELIFIKGGNGKGKSTLVKLLTGIYDITKGQILVNGISIQEYRHASLREKIVVVPQENRLFQGSIRDNLACGKKIDMARMEKVCKKTGIYEEIMRMPDGFETVLTENGGTLSGGQKQRLCLARVLLRDGDVYIFDEPTSALDKMNQDRFVRLLNQLAEDRIVVIITHDRELLDSARRVVDLNAERHRSGMMLQETGVK